MSGAVPEMLQQTLNHIHFSNCETVRFNEIFLIVPMLVGGVPEAAMAVVDLSEGDDVAGLEGKTMRDWIREVYHCETPEEVEHLPRHYFASQAPSRGSRFRPPANIRILTAILICSEFIL
jgi:hypothetical protein